MGQRQSEIIKNHMEVYWHDYASASKGVPITEAGLVEKASVIGRTGLMLLECGTGAWRVRSSMNALSRELGVTTTADIGLLSINDVIIPCRILNDRQCGRFPCAPLCTRVQGL